MNIFDIITIIVLLLAAIAGARKGFISQLFSLLSIVGGVILASAYGASVGQMLNLDPAYSKIVGYIITFIATSLAASLVAKLLATLFSALGLGSIDTLLGVVLSAAKYLLLLSVVFICVERLNNNLQIIEARHFEGSKSFTLVSSLSGTALEWFNTYTEEAN
jgi:membrane protein required for colicin V production